ncbi:uncharacterized protein LOC121425966 [Lytechinus variegatus]|uniref:uncharacterized protein LOC121425966 n=1 Tax=Lytechinus variegatus TaxID=7654 RepID=UPI001BB29584|nr:uncharacterized protein LOC121425966 [Lytechinus variegatus]
MIEVVPINFSPNGDVIDQPSTSYQRDETINAHDFLAYQRFLASTVLKDDGPVYEDDDDMVKQNQPSMSYPPGKVKKSCDILVIDHPSDEEPSAHITPIKARPGGVAFEVANNFDPITDVADVKVSRGGVAFEITTDKSPVPSAESTEPSEMSLPSPPITTMSCTRHTKEGVAFEIDFGDNEEQKRQLQSLSKVTSRIAKEGWSERDVIKETDDVWVANKVLAMNDNAKRNEKRLASLRKAEEEFDLMTATMTERALDSFHYILVKETCTEHSLLRRAQFKAWQKKMMQ